MSKIFVSYAKSDKKLIDKLNLWKLLEDKVRRVLPRCEVYRDEGIPVGADWYQHLQHGARGSFAAVLLLSKKYFQTTFALPKEYGKMLRPRMEQGDLYVCSVLITEIDESHLAKNFPELEKRQWFSVSKDDASLKHGVQKLVRALRVRSVLIGNVQGHDPDQAAEVDNELARLRRAEFVGREWLFGEILRRFEQNTELRTLVIVGPPGVGKTAIATEIGRSLSLPASGKHGLRGRLLAQHWCLNDQVDTTGRPTSFVRSIAREFTRNHPNFGGLLDEEHVKALERMTDAGAAQTFVEDLIRPLCKMIEDEDETYYIVVDALDQTSDDAGGNAIPVMLSRAAKFFPSNLRLIVTILEPSKALDRFPVDRHTDRIRIDQFADQGKHDVGEFAKSWFHKFGDKLSVDASLRRLMPDEFAQRIVEASQGNFLVAELECRGLGTSDAGQRSGHLIASDGSLDDYLGKFFKRRITAATREDAAWLLGLMIAAGTALPSALIDAVFKGQPRRIQNAKGAIGALLKGDSILDFFHPHLRRWMCNPDNWQRLQAKHEHEAFAQCVTAAIERAHETLSMLSCPRRPTDVGAMRRTAKPCGEKATCSVLLATDLDLPAPLKLYALDHGPRHFIRQRLLDCAIESLIVPDKTRWSSSGNRERHLRMLMIEIGNLLTRRPVPNLSWATSDLVDRIIELVEDQYETEPFISVARLVVETQLQRGEPVFRQSLVDKFKDDYVWRFAAAYALAEACYSHNGARAGPNQVLHWILDLANRKELYFRELGAYALGLAYAADWIADSTDIVDRLGNMVTDKVYPPRSAFGDAMLNLAAQALAGQPVGDRMQALLPKDWFQASPWEHNQLDVVDCAALMQLAGFTKFAASTGAPAERVRIAHATFARVQDSVGELLAEQHIGRTPKLEQALRNYWLLGNRLALLRDAEDELLSLPAGRLAEVMAVFFSHPLWWVTEAAASVLASVAEISQNGLQAVESLLGNDDDRDRRWRIKLGATEAAFDMRHLGLGDNYERSIEASWQDDNPRIRGLCAENLIAAILEQREWSKRNEAMVRYQSYIKRWLADDDCWVLEHPYRLVRTFRDALESKGGVACQNANATLDGFIAEAVKTQAALLNRHSHWEKLDRQAFLLSIERLKSNRLGSSSAPKQARHGGLKK